MRTAFILACLAAGFGACRGSVPPREGRPEPGKSAVLIGGRLILPSGQSYTGSLAINLEGEGTRLVETYRLPVSLKRTLLYQIEPGLYRLRPTRSIWGGHQPELRVEIEGVEYRVPFPREIMRKDAIEVKHGKAVAIGVLEARLSPALPGQESSVKVRLDDSVEARRDMVEKLIREMMDPQTPTAVREHAISWSRALERALIELAAETERPKLYKTP